MAIAAAVGLNGLTALRATPNSQQLYSQSEIGDQSRDMEGTFRVVVSAAADATLSPVNGMVR